MRLSHAIATLPVCLNSAKSTSNRDLGNTSWRDSEQRLQLCAEPSYLVDPKDVHKPDFPGETFRVLKEKEERLYGEYRTRIIHDR